MFKDHEYNPHRYFDAKDKRVMKKIYDYFSNLIIERGDGFLWPGLGRLYVSSGTHFSLNNKYLESIGHVKHRNSHTESRVYGLKVDMVKEVPYPLCSIYIKETRIPFTQLLHKRIMKGGKLPYIKTRRGLGRIRFDSNRSFEQREQIETNYQIRKRKRLEKEALLLKQDLNV